MARKMPYIPPVETAPAPVQYKRAPLKFREAAEYLKLSMSAFYVLLHKGELPVIRFSKSSRIDPDDLDAFIASKKTTLAHATLRKKQTEAA